MTDWPAGTFEDDGMETILLADTDAWDAFVAAGDNRAEIESRYGSVERAERIACEGGLVLGGGADPVFHVRFEG